MKRFVYVVVCVSFFSFGCPSVHRENSLPHTAHDGWVFNYDKHGLLEDARYIENGEVRYLLDSLPNGEIFRLGSFERGIRNGLTVALVHGKAKECCEYRKGRPFCGKILTQSADGTVYEVEYSDYKIVSKRIVQDNVRTGFEQ